MVLRIRRLLLVAAVVLAAITAAVWLLTSTSTPGSDRAASGLVEPAPSTGSAAGGNEATATADAGLIGATYANCKTFDPTGCPIRVLSSTSPDGATVYAVWLTRQYGTSRSDGALFFFHGATLLPGAHKLAPHLPSEHGPGLGEVEQVSVSGPGAFRVVYRPNSPSTHCAGCARRARSATYVYGWRHGRLVVRSR